MADLVEIHGSGLWFFCSGCQGPHRVPIAGENAWTWNGSTERPTLSPSIRCRWNEGEAQTPKVCHSFMRDGALEFLGDCTHELAGRTVPIVPWEAWGEYR
jgi:hypothetical protein